MLDPANREVSQIDSVCAVITLHALCFISILHFPVVLLSSDVDFYCFVVPLHEPHTMVLQYCTINSISKIHTVLHTCG